MEDKKKDVKAEDPTRGPAVRGSASKDEGDQALIRQQRAEQRGNGKPTAAPTAGGVTRKQDTSEG